MPSGLQLPVISSSSAVTIDKREAGLALNEVEIAFLHKRRM
jgi:hypothetical protein